MTMWGKVHKLGTLTSAGSKSQNNIFGKQSHVLKKEKPFKNIAYHLT